MSSATDENDEDVRYQSTSHSTNFCTPFDFGNRQEESLAAVTRVLSNSAQRHSLSNRTSRRPQLCSENTFGTIASQHQRTNHLTVECLVSVRAHVLTWDDALGGWLPVDDGALCGVSLLQQITCQQCLSPSVVHPVKRSSWSGVLSQKSLNAPNMIMAPQWEYQIQGKRISDQTVLLNCTLMPHITYRNAMPTFHHWRIKDQRFGLSFGSAYDASKFYNRLQKALEHLCHQSKSSFGESNLDASDELEDDVFAPTELPDSFSSTSTARPISSFNTRIVEPQTAPLQPKQARKEHQSQSLPPIASEQYPIPVIRTALSSLPVTRRQSTAFDECPPMDPERARPCLTHTRSAPSTKKQILYANVETSLQQQPFNETTDKPVEQREKIVDNVESKNRKKSGAVDEKGEEDDLMITDDALSLPTTLQQSFAISSLSSVSKTDSKRTSEKRSFSRLRSKSRSEISSLGYRVPVLYEKMRSASNPCADLFLTRSRHPHFERYVSSPFDVDGVRSFIEAHSSLYKNGEHIVLPKKKEPSSEMMRRECCFYCRNWYNIKDNQRGCCKEAPDPVELTIRRLTCYSVAQGVIYHCCRNDEETAANMGRYGHGYNVCSCAPSNLSRKKRLKRWILLALLSLLIPCLCCYVPAHYAYGCCCKAKRGRHKPCLNPNERDYLLARRRTSRAMSRLSF